MESRKDQPNSSRTLVWVSERSFQAWTCSQCEWNYPVPTLLSDPEAKTAFDRLAVGKFREHSCDSYPPRLTAPDSNSFSARVRRLVAQGFKPKDAVDLLLQELALEYRGQPKALEQARIDADDFLRRLRAGLI